MTSRDGAATPTATPGAAQTLPPGHPPIGAGAAATGEPGPPVSGSVTLAGSLQGRTGAALFIIVRNAASGQIVAVRKENAAAFPFSFQVSGADAMTEGTAFAGPFDITARLSQSGDAIPAKGDVEGTAKGVAGGARDVRITLDTVRQ
jgi:hypothetical protein